MGTFITWAIGEQEGVVAKATECLTEIRDARAKVKDEAARVILTNVQACLLCLRTQAGDAMAQLKAANRNNELVHVPAPQPDLKRRAAGDVDEAANEEPEDGELRLPIEATGLGFRTKTVEELEQLLKLEA